MDTSNWRTQLSSDSRQKIVNKITDTLKKHEPFSGPEKLHEVKNLALRFEEKIYTTAISHHDYMRKISIKLLNFENKSANPMTKSPQSNSAGNPVNPSDQGSQGMQQVNNQVQPIPVPVPSNLPQAGKQILSQNNHNIIGSSALPPGGGISQSTMPNIASQSLRLQNISAVQQTSVGNSMGQGIRIPSTNFVSQRQIPGSQQQPQNSQHFRYQQQLHQMKLQQNSSTTSMQSHIQQQKLSQPSHFQPSQQSIMQPTMLQNQPPVFPQSGQPLSQQSVLKQQRPQQLQPRLMAQQNNLSSGQHNNLSVIHQQHLGPQSSQKQQHMLNNQHSAQMLQSTQGQKSQVELQQLLMPQLQTHSGQLNHQLNIKPHANLSQGDIQQRPPTSGAFQQQNVLDQQKQLLQQQRVKAEASSTSTDSTAQTGNINCGDWQEEVYQKMEVLKGKYMLELKDFYEKCVAKLRQQQKGEQFEKLKKIKLMLEFCMACLQVPKTNIPPNHKEKLVHVERYILNFMMMYNRKAGITMQQPLTTPHIDSLHQSQQTQVQPHENQMNSHMQSVNLQHNKVAVLQHNNVCMLQPNSNMLQRQQLKQIQHHDMQQQILYKQQLLNQQHQFHPQTKQLQQNGNQINNDNELKIRQLIEMKSESLRQQQLKSGAPFSSPQIDQQILLNSVTKCSTPMQSVNSPFIASSPSTPSTAHVPIEAEKFNSCVSSLSNAAGNIGHQATAAMLRSQPLATGTSGIPPSPLLAEFTSPDENHGNGASVEASGKSSTIEDPMEHLLKVVKSISPKSLSASVSDIGSVVSMIDSIAGSAPGNGSRAEVGQYLVAMTQCRRKRPFITHDETTEARKAKCFNVVSSASSVNDSFNNIYCLAASEVESTANSTTKRRRLETTHPLMEEIRKINQSLVDTVVYISQEDAGPAAASEVGNGTVVKCSFSTVYLGPNLKSQYASAKMPPIQPLQLLVPSNYPNCSPVILDKIPVELSKEYEDLSMKAKWRFSNCMRSLSDPMSLEKMARTWDVCARAVILDYVQQSGGGTFTSKYGAWEDCLTAA